MDKFRDHLDDQFDKSGKVARSTRVWCSNNFKPCVQLNMLLTNTMQASKLQKVADLVFLSVTLPSQHTHRMEKASCMDSLVTPFGGQSALCRLVPDQAGGALLT
eukprot:2664185-Amphidinium_carterae.1